MKFEQYPEYFLNVQRLSSRFVEKPLHERSTISSCTVHFFSCRLSASLLKRTFIQILDPLDKILVAQRFKGKRKRGSLLLQVEKPRLQVRLRSEVVPSLELFQHVQQHLKSLQTLVYNRSGETLFQVVKSAMSQMIEQSLTRTSGSKHSYPVPPSIVAHYLAATFLTLLKWWFTADMAYSPEQMDEFFQQLALPGRWTRVENRSE